jgi:uncharacterized membrane protein YbhN (UPF0104 family)
LSSVDVTETVEIRPSPRRRIVRIVLWLVGLALFWLVLQLLGVDVKGWLDQFWDELQAMPRGYTAAAFAFQTGQTCFTGLSYYGILKAAYRDEVKLWQVIAAYSVGVAMNGFLPANIGTFVTLVMFVAIIPSCTLGGAIAAYLVQKIFFTLAGAFVYLYMFLSVPGEFSLNFGNVTEHPGLTILIVAGVILLLVILGRIFWRQVKKLWAQAKEGGVILSTPRRYLSRVFLPAFLGWLCKLAVTGVFLAAFALPVTFDSVMWVTGSGSLANVTSFTPGSVGVTQATNALALKTCCDVPRSDAVAYSTAQQLLVTAWNQVLAIILVVWVFGWTGGKLLVSQSYADAKADLEQRKEERKRKKLEKKEEGRTEEGA